jgi:hypothetical protein
MNARHRNAFEGEMARARELRGARRLEEALAHLERAHVLGQRHVVPHVRVHASMLALAVRQRDAAGAWGQLVRMVLGALGSAVGRVPIGNTGGSDISMFKELPIDPELSELMGEGARTPARQPGIES